MNYKEPILVFSLLILGMAPEIANFPSILFFSPFPLCIEKPVFGGYIFQFCGSFCLIFFLSFFFLFYYLEKSESAICSVVSDSLWPHGLLPTELLCPWDSPDKNTGVGGHALLQGIFLNWGLNPGLLDCRQILYHLSNWGVFLFYFILFVLNFILFLNST